MHDNGAVNAPFRRSRKIWAELVLVVRIAESFVIGWIEFETGRFIVDSRKRSSTQRSLGPV